MHRLAHISALQTDERLADDSDRCPAARSTDRLSGPDPKRPNETLKSGLTEALNPRSPRCASDARAPRRCKIHAVAEGHG